MVGAEIDNGGFSQFFTNSTGDLIEEAIAGAERFGLREHTQLLREASETLFPGGVPLDHEVRLRAWDELPDEDDDLDAQIEALDEQWSALNEVLEQRLHAYAKAHHAS